MNIELSTTQVVVFSLLIIWELIWKGLGLWKSAQNEQLGWYLAILLLNTLGILPMIYVLSHPKPAPATN